MIIKPPVVFLDTSHLIEIFNTRKGAFEGKAESYKELDTLLRKGYLGVVFSQFQVLEWIGGDATEKSAREIVAVLDSAALKYQIEDDTFVFLSEVLAECSRIEPSLDLPEIQIIQTWPPDCRKDALMVLWEYLESKGVSPDTVLGAEPASKISIKTMERVSDFVEEALKFKTDFSGSYQERINGFNDMYQEDKNIYRSQKTITNKNRLNWLKKFLKVDTYLGAAGYKNRVDDILEKIEIKNCTAAGLWLKAWENFISNYTRNSKNSDVHDWATVHVATYVDFMLTEGPLRHHITAVDANLGKKVFCNHDAFCSAIEEVLRLQ